ncbi:MAG: hypothetical protein PUB20_07780 [Clostridia bacterium]|nr:hypothetical protein [Clostridia bacterium]
MNIGVDIDDTLTNSFDYFLPFVAEYFGADEDELKAKNISYGTLPPEWDKYKNDFGKAYYDKVTPDTPFKPDAAWGINRLREAGHKIIIITHRSTEFYTNPYETTRNELDKGNICYDKLICTTDKATACVSENVSVLIDDLPENCLSAKEHGVHSILFNSKGNKDFKTYLPRVNNWSEAVEVILNFAENN